LVCNLGAPLGAGLGQSVVVDHVNDGRSVRDRFIQLPRETMWRKKPEKRVVP
jgi:hypothetical protein